MRTLAVARGVAWRTLHNVFTNPSLFVPSIVFPLFFFVAFAGGLSRVQDVPGFNYAEGYTAFQFVFVLLQSAAFGGVFTGFGIARDFESGFGRRLLLAAPSRTGILLGYAVAALLRWLVTAAVCVVMQILISPTTSESPRRINVRYIDDNGRAFWETDSPLSFVRTPATPYEWLRRPPRVFRSAAQQTTIAESGCDVRFDNLTRQLYAHLNPMPFEAAAEMEKDLAEDLRNEGYIVAGGT